MKLYELGLLASYQRIMEIEESLASSISERFVPDGCVVPANLRKGLLTIGALDNLDHQPFSAPNGWKSWGTQRSDPFTITRTRTLTTGKVCSCAPRQAKHQQFCNTSKNHEETGCSLIVEKGEEKRWMEETLVKFHKENVMADDMFTWAAFHSAKQVEKDPPALTALLSIFYKKAATPAMIKHGMDVIRQATTFLNPGQVPVITVDQPLFALVKACIGSGRRHTESRHSLP